jgi:putative membrane protein
VRWIIEDSEPARQAAVDQAIAIINAVKLRTQAHRSYSIFTDTLPAEISGSNKGECMNNQQLIKYAHVWFLAVVIACGLVVIAVKAGSTIQNQNSNQNSNSNSNSNANANTQNRNANRSANRNSNNSNNTRAAGQQAGMANMSSPDRDFLMDAAMGGLMEVELGRIAAQKGMSDSVKQFGQRMVDDHSKANQELMSLASSKGVTLPTALDEKHQKDVTKLSAMSGAEFDRAYSKMMLSDHTKDVKEFEKQSTRGADPDLKAFASKTLPTLQEHLQMARSLEPNQRGNRNSNSNSGGSRNSNRNSNSNNSNSNRP